MDASFIHIKRRLLLCSSVIYAILLVYVNTDGGCTQTVARPRNNNTPIYLNTPPETLTVFGHHGYTAAPTVEAEAQNPHKNGLNMKFGKFGNLHIGPMNDPDHDPNTGAYIAPFGEAYLSSSPVGDGGDGREQTVGNLH